MYTKDTLVLEEIISAIYSKELSFKNTGGNYQGQMVKLISQEEDNHKDQIIRIGTMVQRIIKDQT